MVYISRLHSYLDGSLWLACNLYRLPYAFHRVIQCQGEARIYCLGDDIAPSHGEWSAVASAYSGDLRDLGLCQFAPNEVHGQSPWSGGQPLPLKLKAL